jgi:cytoskeletal protein CcmA (bactofilin family)
MKTITSVALLMLCLAAGAQAALEQKQEQNAATVNITVDSTKDGGHFAAGCPVSVKSPVDGDFVATGCKVEVLADISGDLIVLGGDLRLSASVKQNLYAAGGKVRLNPDSKVGGNVDIGAGDVTVEGTIAGNLKVGGGTVRIDGPVAGNVDVGAGEVELGPHAHISGKLRYTGRDEITTDPAAKVDGGVERRDQESHWDWNHNWNYNGDGGNHWNWRRDFTGDDGYAYRWNHGWGKSIVLLFLAAVLAAALPRFCESLARNVPAQWPLSLLIGCTAFVGIPVVAVIAAITLIGIPLAILLVAFYVFILTFGYVSAGVAVGQLALQKWRADKAADNGWRVGAAALGMLSISLLGRVPLIGWVVTMSSLLIGMGLLIVLARMHAAPVAPAA